jgi:hypothetical protein
MELGLKTFAGALLASAIGLTLVSTAASANPIVSTTYTSSLPQSSTDWSSAFNIPKFNPALGTLLSVEVNLTGGLQGSLKVANTKTFNNVITATAATPSTAGWTNGSHNTHCTAASTTCSVWNITYTSTPPSVIPASTINSSLGATITMHLGSNLVVVLPVANVSDTLDAGPQNNPATYTFTKQYGASNGSSAPIAKSAALAKTISGPGIQSPGTVPVPGGLASPCDGVYGPCTVGSHTYNVGVTYAGLTATDSKSADYTAPTDLAFFQGLGWLVVPVNAVGTSAHDGGANVDFASTASANAQASFTYTYVDAPEPLTLALVGGGIIAAGALRRRRKNRA